MSDSESEPITGDEPSGVSQRKRTVVIMRIAAKIVPSLAKALEGKLDNKGKIFRPSHIRGIAIALAENMYEKVNTSDQIVEEPEKRSVANEQIEPQESSEETTPP
jgi:hypothetical protein